MGWERRFFASTRGRIVALLRRRSHTVEELAQALDLTDNAVRGHLAALERDRLVEQAGTRRRMGKPAYAYVLTAEAAALFPKAYAAVLSSLLAVLEERRGAAELDAVVRASGRRIAVEEIPAEGDVVARLEGAVTLLNSLGGLAELQRAPDGYRIQGYSCPLGALPNHHPQVCNLAESLVATATDLPIKECCTRGSPPRCCFRVVGHA